jgi:hypothetical protein
LRTITIIVGMLALSVQAQEIYTGAIAISPSQRTNSWRPTNTLAPGDSAKLSITVAQSGTDNGRNYTLHGNPIQHPPISSPPGSIIWRGTYSSLHACNAGNSPGTTTATVTAKWIETGGGGGGGTNGGSPSIIYGEATGIAQADIPVFSWSFDQRMQFTDGTSPITYTVTGSITGRRVTMSAYSVKPLSGELSVTPDPLSSTNIRTGKITSTNSAKSKMGVYYGERELARSDDEIAFAKVDLIIPPGPGSSGGTPLPEDRQPAGGTAPATNELNPGTIVLLLPQDQTNRVATTLTLKADPTGGSVTLDQHGLTDLKIYSDGALQEELTLPKTWTNGDTPPTTLYMVGSSASTNLQSAQGTLDLTYKANLAANGAEYSVKDTVGVTLLPVEIVDKDKKALTKLKVGKMAETGVLSGAEASASLDIDKDSDLFYVRIPGAASMGAISIKIATVDNPDTAYNDDETQIDMQVEGNNLITKSMLLVSDDVDDDHQVDGVADDAKNDRTHKIQLGGKFQVKSIKIGGTEHQADIKTPVPVEKTVPLAVVILRESAGGPPVIAQATVETDLRIAQERYAQVGVRLSWAISINDPPPGVNLTDGSLDEFSVPQSPTAEEIALITGLGTPKTDDLHVFYVNQLSSGSFGEAFIESITPSPIGENVIISSSRRPFTLPHELGHVLKADGNHVSNVFQLMRGSGTSATNVLGASKRLNVPEQTTIGGSKHAK